MSPRRRWLIVWVLALLPLLGWWLYGLFDIDEGFYGAATAEMNRRHEWITPFYNGKPWFEKPILLYWLAKPCLLLFGDMVGPRLPDILTTLGTYGIVAWFAKRRCGQSAAMLATLMVASSLLVIAVGRLMMTDPPLLLCLTAAMATFWESLVGKASWRVWTAALLGLGVLAKGPVALILFAIIAAWTYCREPELRPAFRGYWLQGTTLMALIICSWYVPAYLANGNVFVQKFLIEQNVGRFTGGDVAHTLPGISGLIAGVVAYGLLILLGMMPWSFFIWKAWPRTPTAAPLSTERDSATVAFERYLAVWASVIFVFFAISGAKLPHYLLPIMPPLCILVAAYAVRTSSNIKRWFIAAATSCLLMTVIANGGFLYWFKKSGQQEAQGIARYVKKEGGAVAMYQMGRREKELGTGKSKIMETSLPSLVMILDKEVIDTDNLDEISRAAAPIWIITRNNRIRPEDFIRVQRAGHQLVELKPPIEQDSFKLFQIR